MKLIIDLPDREEALAFHRQRWADVLQDRQLARLNRRIETNGLGQIVMTPPATGPHYSRQAEIAFQLRTRLGAKGFADFAVVTSDGVKIADAGWYSDQRYGIVRGQDAFEVAPEICVEVLSPSNTQNEIQNKFRLYFEAGAEECWTCDAEGRMTYYFQDSPDSPHNQSRLCPDFPNNITD